MSIETEAAVKRKMASSILSQNVRVPDRRRGSINDAIFGNALEALTSNRLRSFLTMLGMIIGVSAVIAVVTLTLGVNKSVNDRFAGLGTNVLTIASGVTSSRGARTAAGSAQTLTLQDGTAVAALPHVADWSPILNSSGQVVYGDQNWSTSVHGVYPAYQTIQNWQMAQGAWFSDQDEQAAVPVAVLGQTVVTNLFSDGTVNPIGQTIRIAGQTFRVVGVLQSKGSQGAGDGDDVIFVPFSAAYYRLKPTGFIDQIQLQVDDSSNITQVQTEATALLRKRHHLLGPDPSLTQTTRTGQRGGGSGNLTFGGGGGFGPPGGRQGGQNGGGSTSSTSSTVKAQADDFQVFNVSSLIQASQANSAVLTTLLIGIAAISLSIGGIGIMNIMLVSVSERKREIGILKAIGARERDIRTQFLQEALLLSIAGGLIGILIGLLAGVVLTSSLGFPFIFSAVPIVVAFGVSAVVGVGFGFYPAMRASRLDPILALQSVQ